MSFSLLPQSGAYWRRAVAAVLVAGIISAGAAQAQIIHACYVPSSGTIYRIKVEDPNEACKAPQHVEFSWNVQGPAGADGTDGVSGWEIVQEQGTLQGPGSATASATCPAGKRVLGGGYFFLTDSFSEGRVAFQSAPFVTETGTSGWRVRLVPGEDPEHNPDFFAYAVCAYVTAGP